CSLVFMPPLARPIWRPRPPFARTGFAHGHRGIQHDAPYVYEITAARSEVAFTCDDRGEAEVVLLRVTPEMVGQAIENAD
ncbi:hypothetical protein O4J55_07455, partial [Paracoccus sp. PXZ]